MQPRTKNSIEANQDLRNGKREQRVFNNRESDITEKGSCLDGECVGQFSEINLLDIDFNSPKTTVVDSDGSVKLVGNQKSKDSKDLVYNSYADWRAPEFNQWTRIHDDNCNEQNRLKIGAKPMKYYVNEFNTPQNVQYMQYTIVGGQKQYNISNEYERPIPSRLNSPKTVFVLPYRTTPFLGMASVDRMYVDTNSQLRLGQSSNNSKTALGTSEVDYNRWTPGVSAHTVQNAGQFAGQFAGMKMQQPIRGDPYYDYSAQNNVLYMNSTVPQIGISTRNALHNFLELSKC